MGLALWVSSVASAAPASPDLGRLSVTGYGSWAYQPAAPALAARPVPQMMGCGGGGGTYVPETAERRGRRGRRVVIQPSHQRYVVRLFDACSGIGAGAESANYVAPFQVGYGGQWGGERVYVAAQAEVGLANYNHRFTDRVRVNHFGIGLKPKVALGLQLGPVGVEVGPTVRALVPLITETHNASQATGWMAAGSIDVEFTFGAGIGPKRWYRGRI
jgi:hypothetical protein